MPNPYRVSFGDVRIGNRAIELISKAIARNWISEGENVRLFEDLFAKKFGWKHAIATSSGTDAGIVVWAAIREKRGISFGRGFVYTPACAFVATTNCLLASGNWPSFVDVELDTLNMNPHGPYFGQAMEGKSFVGFQFVATIGKPSPIDKFSLDVRGKGFPLVADFCEAHGARLNGIAADHYADAAIYSFYAAHLIVAGEGGMICTDDDEIAALCRSIKSHGRRGGDIHFHFDRIGYNSKMNELTAAVGIEGLERFEGSFEKRRALRAEMLDKIKEAAPTKFIQYREEEGEIIAPHAFPLVLKDPDGDITPLYNYLEAAGIQCKTLFGSLPTQHEAFAILSLGEFPVAERIGRTGLHFGMHEYMTQADLKFIAETISNFYKEGK